MKTPSQSPLHPIIPAGFTVKVIGLGGVGGPVARYLSLFLAAQPCAARLVLIDGDAFEPSNAARMFFGNFGNKATVLRTELLERVGDSSLTLEAIPEFVTPRNIETLIRNGEVVLMAVDNHATRKLINDHCRTLDEVCLISGGNDGIEAGQGNGPIRRGTYGNVQVYWRREGREVTPELSRYHPEIASPSDRSPEDLSCTELMMSVPQLLFANLTVASALLNTFWLCLCSELPYDELAFDIAEGLMRPITFRPNAV